MKGIFNKCLSLLVGLAASLGTTSAATHTTVNVTQTLRKRDVEQSEDLYLEHAKTLFSQSEAPLFAGHSSHASHSSHVSHASHYSSSHSSHYSSSVPTPRPSNPVPVNHKPFAPDKTITLLESSSKTFSILATDRDADNLTYSIVAQPQYGKLTGTTIDKLVYTPNPGFHGTDHFTFRANDGTEDSNLGTVTIQVTSLNHAPVASAMKVEGETNTPLPITLVATDEDGDSLTYSIVAKPINGVLSGEGNELVYTPDDGFTGKDVLSFRASDGKTKSNNASVHIKIKTPNQNSK